MTTPKSALVPTAITQRSNINLSFPHVSTADFMQFNCSAKRVLNPTQTYNIQHNMFTRLQPMEVPTFGDAKIINRAFFVPFRTVMPSWNDFITDSIHPFPDGDIDHVPCNIYFTNQSLINLFMNPIYATSVDRLDFTGSAEDMEKTDTHDIVIKESVTADNVVTLINLNRKGRLALKILHQLGYGINVDERGENISYSAMSLLCLSKVYMDWYYPQAYIQDERAQIIMSYFTRDSLDQLELSTDDLYNIFEVISYCNYDSDYFVSSWDNPVAPSNGSYSNITINDPTIATQVDIFNQANGTPVVGTNSRFTEYSLDALKAVTDYMKRHQISGARCLDRYLSRFGIVLNSDKLLRSHYLTDYSNYIQFGDVTSTASTESSSLGSYAGKGVGIVNGEVTFTTDEYGMFFIISTIQPQIGYYQGVHRENLYMTKLDYPTPEFDGLSVQAIGLQEVYCPLNVTKNGLYNRPSSSNIPMNYDDHVFGFVPKYAEAKIANAMLTGDFRFGSLNAGTASWHLFRDLYYTVGQGNLVHDVNFTRGIDAGQYDRIFQVTDTDVDHFTVIHQFKVTSSYPGSSLYDNYEFEDEDKAKKVKVDINGVKAN